MGKQFQQSKKQGTEEERTFQVLPFLSEFSKLVLVTVTYIDSWAHSQINQSDSLGAKCKDLQFSQAILTEVEEQLLQPSCFVQINHAVQFQVCYSHALWFLRLQGTFEKYQILQRDELKYSKHQIVTVEDTLIICFYLDFNLNILRNHSLFLIILQDILFQRSVYCLYSSLTHKK